MVATSFTSSPNAAVLISSYRATIPHRRLRGVMCNLLARAGRVRRLAVMATAAFMLPALSCTDKAFVSSLNGNAGEAMLGVSVALGELQADDISAVRVIARYAGPAGLTVLRDVTVPYTQGESRSIPLALDIAACLRDANSGTAASPSCPVQTTVEVLSGARVLARDDLPVVQVRPGETVSTPALAARSATSVRLRHSNAVVTAPIALVVGGNATLVADALDVSGATISGRTIAWSSSAPAVASVSNAGVVTALSTGSATISAAVNSGSAVVRSSATVNVSAPVPAALQLSPNSTSVDVGATRQLTPTVTDASGAAITPVPALTWTSSQATIATVSGSGLVTGVAPGSVVITAQTANGVAGTATVVVAPVPTSVSLAPAAPTLAIGATQTLVATVRDASGAAITPVPALTWSTSAATIAAVSNTGVVTAVAAGTATITARTANGAQGTATITVSSPVPATVQLAPTPASVVVGGTQALTATVRDGSGAIITPVPALTWTSSAQTIATVSASGVVTGVAAGSATITARTANNITGTATVTVTVVPARVVLSISPGTVAIGATATITPTVTDASGAPITPTPALTWSTSAAAIATVSQTGVVTGVAAGSATITAQTQNGIQGTTTVTVTNAATPATIALSPTTLSVAQGASQAITAVVRDASGNQITPTPALVWSSSNTGVASVSATGVVTGVSDGFATITARTANNLTATVSVNVGASGSFTARVYEFTNNQPVANATVTVSVPAGPVRTVTTDAQGNFNTGTLFGGPFSIRITATGFAPVDVRNLALDGARTLEAIPLARTTTNGSGAISGTVYNAVTDTPVLTVSTLELFAGVNSQDGTPIATTNTSQGNYRFSFIPAGTYTIRARANGFSAGTRTVVSTGGGQDAAGQHVLLSPTSTTGSLRIVLSWGDSPADLDAHLTGPTATGPRFWIYFQDPGSCTSSPFACLDVDAQDGRGPETMTISQRVAGRYVYSVHNYSDDNGSSGNMFGLAQSNARVDVYGPSGLIQSFSPPAGPGFLWTVFEWDGTTVRPINSVGPMQFPPSAERAASSLDAAAGRARLPAKPKRVQRR